MRIKHFLLVLSFLSSGTIISQTNITGFIMDAFQKPIPFTSLLLQSQDSITVSYTYSNNNGFYELELDETGDFNLIVSMLGYEKLIQPISITKNTKNLKKDIELKEKLFELNEVIVNADLSIDIKKDTIVYNVKTFLRGNEVVLEDLLKNLPGINVDSDGTIKFGNQEIEKLMVDGDDFFEKGYKILSKSLPVHPLESVELLQKYSNSRLLKGIENSDKVALNLKLKEEAKNIWFGDITMGYGLELSDFYTVKGNLANFSKKKKFYFLSNLNNTGDDSTGDINQLIRPYRYGEPSSIGDNQRLQTLNNISGGINDFKESRTNFNNAELLSLNAIYKLSNKVKMKTLGFLNTDEIQFFSNTIDNFNTSGLNFSNTEDVTILNNKLTAFGKIDLTYDISERKMLESTTKFNYSNFKDNSDLNFNGLSTLQSLASNNNLFDYKIGYSDRFADKKVFLLTGRYIKESSPQNFTINRFLYQDLFPEISNANNISQISENQYQFIGVEGHLLEKKQNGNLLEFKLGNELRIDDLRSIFNIKNNNILLENPDGFQNTVEYRTNDLYFKTKYLFKINKIGFIGKLDFHQLFNNLEFSENNKSQSVFFINPSLGLNWEINKSNEIDTSVSITTNNADVLSTSNNFSLTGFRFFSKGTGDFNQLNAFNYSFNYKVGDFSSRFFSGLSLNYIKNNDFFSTNTSYDPNFSLSEKILIKDREFLNAAAYSNFYFRKLKSTLKLSLGYSKSNFQNNINDTGLRLVKNQTNSYQIKLKSAFNGFFNYNVGTEWLSNSIEISTFKNKFTNNTSYLDLAFAFTDKFTLDVQTERYFFGNLQGDNTYYFLDLTAKYVLKKNKLTLFFDGRNLFDNNTFRTFSINDVGNTTTEYRLLPRILLLKFAYRF